MSSSGAALNRLGPCAGYGAVQLPVSTGQVSDQSVEHVAVNIYCEISFSKVCVHNPFWSNRIIFKKKIFCSSLFNIG